MVSFSLDSRLMISRPIGSLFFLVPLPLQGRVRSSEATLEDHWWWDSNVWGCENPHRALRALKGAGKVHYVRIDLGVGCKGDTSSAGHKAAAAVRSGSDGGIGGTMGRGGPVVLPGVMKGGDRSGEGAFRILGQGRGP
jgi:hypothetical protein